MGAGADAAVEATDVVFMNLKCRAYSAGYRNCPKNWHDRQAEHCSGTGCKSIGVDFRICCLANIWLAIFADTGVLVLCILNSLRLLK